jgi:uncharacterized protein YciI
MTVETNMKSIVITLALLFTATLAAQPQQNPNIPKGMKQYFFGFLVKGEKWAQTPPKEQLDLLLQQHLAYIRSQAEAGKYSLAGPFLDNDRIRGILIINAASVEEARQIASGDPMVQSGRMAVEIHPAMLADVSCVLMEYNKTAK